LVRCYCSINAKNSEGFSLLFGCFDCCKTRDAAVENDPAAVLRREKQREQRREDFSLSSP
jgi:hypothetical protein